MNDQELYKEISIKFNDIRSIVLNENREDEATLIGWLESLHYVKNLMGDIEGICCNDCGNEYCSCYDINMNSMSDDFGLRVL